MLSTVTHGLQFAKQVGWLTRKLKVKYVNSRMKEQRLGGKA